MNYYEATEIAYKNGYEAGKNDAVVHGRWRYEGLNAVCSNCGFKWFEGCQECGVCPSDVNYCPHCGAKMDLEI